MQKWTFEDLDVSTHFYLSNEQNLLKNNEKRMK